MNKIFILSTIFCLLFLSFPINTLGQIDTLWMLDNDALLDETGPEINLKTLELYWWADSYAPFGYSGRTLPVYGSSITVNADLQITSGNPKNLKYSWFLDEVFQESKSGYGQDGFRFRVRRFANASHTVLLKVFNESRSFLVEKSISIPVVNPEIVVYRKNNAPFNLTYLSSEKNFELISDKETAFVALPYFFNIKSLNDLEFEWILGDKSVKESSLLANIFGLKIINKQVSGPLQEILKVFVSNKKQGDQKIRKTIPINIY